jgi:hypothetical protein
MSAFDETTKGTTSGSGEAEEVRRVFAALPFEQRLSTLLKVELDIVVDVIETVASAISQTVDDLTEPFTTSSASQTSSTSTDPAASI